MEGRAGLSNIQNTYVYSLSSNQRVPLRQVSDVTTHMAVPRIFRRNQFRKVTVSAFPIPGVLPSQVLAPLMDKIKEFQRRLPPGYSLEFGGQYFGKLATVLDLVGQDLDQQGDSAPAETLAGIPA